jgi:type I restriction enzyme, S subunit
MSFQQNFLATNVKNLPNAWEIKRLKFIAQVRGGVTKGRDLSNKKTIELPYLRVANVQAGYLDLDDIKEIEIEPNEETRYSLRVGDVLMNEGGDNDKLGRGAVWEGQIERCLHQNHVFCVRPNDLDDSYWINWATQTQYLKFFFLSYCKQSTNLASISSSNIKEAPIVFPPKIERLKLAQFLDRKTTKIDTLIAKKKRLIELLEEKRSALINQAVTKGVGRSVRMKDSGVSWIGEIPEHWEVIQLKRAFVLQRGIDITKEQQTDGEVPVVSSGGIASYHDTIHAKAPGVVIGRKGSVGKVHYLDQDYWPHDTTLWVIEFYNNHPRFVYYKLLSMSLASWDTGSANPTLNRNLLHPIKTAWPSPKEQAQIVKVLDAESSNTKKLIERIEYQIKKLQEYRQSLITAAVTGKLAIPAEEAP